MATSHAVQASERAQPGPDHARLDVFVGKWNTKGRQYACPFGPAADVAAVETYEWLAGGLFLIHRFDGRVGEGEAACIEIIGHEAASQCYPVHTFYNDGRAQQWRARERDGVWTLRGEWQHAGTMMHVRCTTVFSDGGRIRTGKWEYSTDGVTWHTFWDVKATRA